MKIIFIVLFLFSNLFYCQNYTPDFDIPKFIQSGGVSKEVYHKKNEKLELIDQFYYNKDSALINRITNQTLPDGDILKEIKYFLDSQNKIIKEEIQTANAYSNPTTSSTQVVTYNYFGSHKIVSFHDKKNKIYLKEYYFYNDKNELVENFTISNDDLTLHERNIYYEKNGYQINEKETYTGLRYKTIVKTKLDKNGFPIYTESVGKIVQDGEKMPKQITYFQNEVDEKGNLSKVFIIEGKKKILIKEVINKYK